MSIIGGHGGRLEREIDDSCNFDSMCVIMYVSYICTFNFTSYSLSSLISMIHYLGSLVM